MRSGVTLLLDRDGTLIDDVPYNSDPARVQLLDGVSDALQRVRARGGKLALISNQSAIAKGLATESDVRQVNGRVSDLIGGFDLVLFCPHDATSGCSCRKPAPGLIVRAIETLGAQPERTVMIGDIGSDIQAAQAAGIRSILVPTPATRREEVLSAPTVRRTFADAVAAVCAFADTGEWL